jgi:anti-sigma B factor antagonist
MEIQDTESEGLMVVAVTGKIDARTIKEFDERCEALPVMTTIFDLSGLEYMSSHALRTLLHMKREFAKQSMPVILAGSKGLVEKLLRVSGFDQVFPLYPTVNDAVKAVAGSRPS